MRFWAVLLMLLLPLSAAAGEGWQHALTLFGTPKYPASFQHFDYVNPNAPKGGDAKMGSPGTFDSLNSFIMKGVKAPGLNYLYDSLMTSSLDEPQSYYPLVARRYRMADDRSWIEFELNEAAQWQDGQPITPEDVVWTLETLKTKGDPVYRLTYQPLLKAEKTGAHRVKITLDTSSREAPILAATLPVLPRHYYATVDFEKTTLTPPLGSGPYRIDKVDVGRSITYQRDPDYWGKNLPVNRGLYNIDTLRYDVYRDTTVMLEALKAGEFDIHREYISRNWATAYDTPAVRDGRLIKTEIPDHSPQGMQAFFFNLRKAPLNDRALREAIALTMDFEWTNKALFYGAYARNTSFFGNTPFAATEPPDAAEIKLLEPFRDQLPPQVFTTAPQVPITDGSGQNRTNLLKAQSILDAAGYQLNEDGKRVDPVTGKVVSIEFMLNQPTMQRVILPMLRGLKKLGIEGRVRLVDDAQYQRRIETFDFDIISNWINLGVVFPGVEQTNYWHSSQADIEGSNNLSGMRSPAVDALLEAINRARTMEELQPAARALDRVLMWEQVVIPHWHSDSFRMAFWNKFGRPKTQPYYGLGFDSWWIKESGSQEDRKSEN